MQLVMHNNRIFKCASNVSDGFFLIANVNLTYLEGS